MERSGIFATRSLVINKWAIWPISWLQSLLLLAFLLQNPPLMKIFHYAYLNYSDLHIIFRVITVKECTISMTPKETELVRPEHSQNHLYGFRMRTGRITASRFKSAACTNPASPSISLIMSICHKEMMKFKNAATCWGCEHEELGTRAFLPLLITISRSQTVDCLSIILISHFWGHPLMVWWHVHAVVTGYVKLRYEPLAVNLARSAARVRSDLNTNEPLAAGDFLRSRFNVAP